MSRFAHRSSGARSSDSGGGEGAGEGPSRAFQVPSAYWQHYGIARKESGGAVAGDAERAASAAPTSGGAPLPAGLRGQFEGSLGADLGGVRLHTGDGSA